MDPVVGDLGALLLPLHHLDDGPVGLQVGRVVDLVEHHLGRVPDPDGGRRAGLVHRVIREQVGRPAHGDRRHEARLVRARPVDVVEVGVVDLVADRGGGPPVRLEGGAVRVEELAGVDEAPYAVVDPADVPVVVVLVDDPEGPLRGARVEEGGVPDLGPVAVVEVERRCEEVDPLDLDVVLVVAGHPIGLGLDANVQVVGVLAPARHVVERVVGGLVIEEPLPVGVEQLELLSQEVHVVLVLPLVGGHLGVGEGALAGVEGEDLSAPRPERPDVQHGGRADWVDPAGNETRVAGAAGGVILQRPVQVLDAVPVAPAEVELLARGAPDIGIAVPIIVSVVDVGPRYGAVGPVVVVVQGREVREVRVRPPGRHLLLVAEEELPGVLGEVHLPDPAGVELAMLSPSRVQVASHALGPVQDDPSTGGGTQRLALRVE